MIPTPRTRILLLGGTGMVGSQVARILGESSFLDVASIGRNALDLSDPFQSRREFQKLVKVFKPDYVINCAADLGRIRTISSLCHQLQVNGLFPRFAAKLAERSDFFLIHLSSDAVFFGKKGNYLETSFRIPRSFYSISKILGEKKSDSSLVIRCSVVGESPSNSSRISIFSWFKQLLSDAKIEGYVNQRWNGVTSTALAKLILGITEAGYCVGGVHHFIPADSLSKYELLELFREITYRSDVEIVASRGAHSINRILLTNNPVLNAHFWTLAGHVQVPQIKRLIKSDL